MNRLGDSVRSFVRNETRSVASNIFVKVVPETVRDSVEIMADTYIDGFVWNPIDSAVLDVVGIAWDDI